MKLRKKPVDKEAARQLRTELLEAISRGELGIQETVRRLRQISRLTQPEFAAHRGVSVKTIKEVERGVGNPTVNTLNQIGQFFGLEVAFVRSETLKSVNASLVAAVMRRGGTSSESLPSARSPVEDAHRLWQDLENIKKMVMPSNPVLDELENLKTGYEGLLASYHDATKFDPAELEGGNLMELHEAVKRMETEFQALRSARDIMESVALMQHKLQPPPILEQWLADIEAARRILNPIK